MLDLHSAQAVEALLVSVLQQAQRIPEAKRRLRTDLVLEVHLDCRDGADRASGRCDKRRHAYERHDESEELEHDSNAIWAGLLQFVVVDDR